VAKQRTEVVAASLLRTWTDADTAMQIVGSSLGVFGAGPLDPTVVLADGAWPDAAKSGKT
jgi:hypothetical protein